MTYLLDTNVVIALLENKPAKVRKRLRRAALEGDTIAVSSVVPYEFRYGVARSSRHRENSERLHVLLSGDVVVHTFGEEDAITASDVRAALEAAGTSGHTRFSSLLRRFVSAPRW